MFYLSRGLFHSSILMSRMPMVILMLMKGSKAYQVLKGWDWAAPNSRSTII